MLILDTVTCTKEFVEILSLIRMILNLVRIVVPIILIVAGSIVLAKAVASSEDKAVKEAQKSLMTKAIFAVLVFLLPLLVNLILGFVDAGTGECWEAAGNCGYTNKDVKCTDINETIKSAE